MAKAPSPEVRILVVDDYEPWRRSACSMLKPHQKYQIVGEAIDGPDAIRKSQELHPDLILLDIGLPVLSGIDAASQICKLVPSVKILFVSQNHDSDVVGAALSDGGHGFVLKAAAGRDLIPAIEAVLRGEKFVSEGFKG